MRIPAKLTSAYRAALIVIGIAMFGLLAPTVGQAAAVRHEFLAGPSGVLSGGVPAGQPVPGPLSGVNALAVVEGHLWIAEKLEGQEASRVDEFSAVSGGFESQLAVVPSLPGLDVGVAVGSGTGEREVYVASAQGDVAVFGPSGALQSSWAGAGTSNKSFTRSAGVQVAGLGGVAVDGSSDSLVDWAAGDVYVATGSESGAPASFDVVDVFAPAAGGGEPAHTVAQLKGTCPEHVGGVCSVAEQEAHPFADPSGVAVSSGNGEVFVVDAHHAVDVFEPKGVGEYAYVGQLTNPPSGELGTIGAVAVDGGNGDIYVSNLTDASAEVVDQFNAHLEYVGELTGTPSGRFVGVRGVAVDPSSHRVFVGDYHGTRNAGFVDVFGGDLFVPEVETGSVALEGGTTATLNGTIDPAGEGEASCQFAWGTSSAFGQTVGCPSVPEGTGQVARQARLTGLQPDTEYCFRLESGNARGFNAGEEWQTKCFLTQGPGLRSAWTTEVSATAATFEAKVEPAGYPVSYFFEYGETTGYEGGAVPGAAGVSIGSTPGEVSVPPVHVQNLSANTVYHYRFVVVSVVEGMRVEFDGPDQTFTTQRTGASAAPPDEPKYEQVSPVDKHGALLSPIGEAGIAEASQTGGAMTYLANAPTEANPKGYFEEVQVLSTRGTGEWHSIDLSLPHATPPGASLAHGPEYRFFSEDLTEGVVEPIGEFTSLAPEVFPADTGRTPYVRHNTTCGSVPARCYEPLLTAAPGYADVPEGTDFNGNPENTTGEAGFVGATPDLGHVVLSSGVPLTKESGSSGEKLYEWSAGVSTGDELVPVSVLPTGEGGELVDGVLGEPNIAKPNADARGAVSGDGSRVFWTGASGGLYLRRVVVGGGGESVRLDVVAAGGSGVGTVAPRFQWANSTGSVVLFSDEQALTPGAGASTGAADLYECDVVETAGKLECVLHDLTPEVGGQQAAVEGLVLGASSDGSTVYFAASGALSEAANSEGEKAVAGGNNLYVVRRDGSGVWEAPVFVAGLSGQDSPDWGTTARLVSSLTARVSGNGQWLVFMSNRSLTGYDNRDAVSEQPDEEVYLFDGSGGGLSCVSCDPSGARPVGVEYAKLNGGLVGGAGVWEPGVWLAGNVPGWTPFRNLVARYQSRYLSNEGRVFFNSDDALVPQDTNKNEDVYEYAPAGVADCTTTYATYSPTAGGCISLISSGTATGESGFLDASESGNDVFFLTSAKLVPQDTDTAVDVYDAHVCTAEAPCASPPVTPPACTTAEACRVAPAPQPSIFGAPPSTTFNGQGNLTAVPGKPLTAAEVRAQELAKALGTCKSRYKKSPKKRAKCEATAKKKFAAKAPKKKTKKK